jgi:hypothetical protein
VGNERLRLTHELLQAVPKGTGAVVRVIRLQLQAAPKEAVAAALEQLPDVAGRPPADEDDLARLRWELRQAHAELARLRAASAGHP